jgi:5'-3' exonuclease
MGYLHASVSIANSSTVAKNKNLVYSTHSDNQEENLILLLNSLKNYIKSFLDCNVMPIFVMDGKSPALKTETRKIRAEDRKSRLEKTEKLRNEIKESYSNGELVSKDQIEELKKYERHNFDVSPYVLPARHLIESMGIPFIQSNTEAEKTCSLMCADGVVEAIMSKDSDCLTFGAPVIIRKFLRRDEIQSLGNIKIEYYDPIQRKTSLSEKKIDLSKSDNFKMSSGSITGSMGSMNIGNSSQSASEYQLFKNSSESKGPLCEVVFLSEILDELDMDMLDFQKFCVLCGCDYNTDGQSSAIHRHGITTLFKCYNDIMNGISKKILEKIDNRNHKTFESRMDVVLMNIENTHREKLNKMCEDEGICMEKLDMNCDMKTLRISAKNKTSFENTVRTCKSFDYIKLKECLEIFVKIPWYRSIEMYDYLDEEQVKNFHKRPDAEVSEEALSMLDPNPTNDSVMFDMIQKYRLNNFSFLSKLEYMPIYYRLCE